MSKTQASSAIPLRELGIVLGIVLVAAMLRLYHLDAESLWYDEVVSVQYLDAPSFTTFIEQERELDPAIVPVYFLLEYLWWHYVSDTEYGLRLLSVAAGLLTVMVVWWLGRNIFSPRAGAVAALCAAFAQNQIYYSQEIRMYALMYLFAALSILMVERAISTGRAGWWLGHWIASALLVWTHVLGALVLLAQGLAILWLYRRQFRAVAIWSAAQGLYLLPLVWWMVNIPPESVDEHLTWIPLPTSWGVVDTFWTVVAGTVLDAEPGFLPRTFSALRSHVVATVLWCCTAWLIWKLIRERLRPADDTDPASSTGPGPLLLVLWCAVPIVMLVVLSLTVRPCYVERYVGHCALPLFVLAGGGIDRLPSQTWRLGVVLFLAVGFTVIASQWTRPLRPDLLSAVDTIERESDGAEHFFLDNKYESGYAFEYYAGVDPSRIMIGKGFLRNAIQRVENRQSTWMLMVGRSRSVREFETVCEASGMDFNLYRFPGRRWVNLVHATPSDTGDTRSP
jgi:4-amino-4-deoxy-L-arabinose transferase-like glycosyltransferase